MDTGPLEGEQCFCWPQCTLALIAQPNNTVLVCSLKDWLLAQLCQLLLGW